MEEVSDQYLPLFGRITNKTTGKTIQVSAEHKEKSEILLDAGSYEAVFTNNPTYGSGRSSGDNRVTTYRFELIAEGSAPGPTINRKSLEESIRKSVTGAYPIYYGLIYSSAAGGNITLAFSSREAARQYAYQYEKGTVEVQTDGSYLYTGSFRVEQKSRYESAWNLTDAMNYFAEQAVHKKCFDLSDESTYLTLTDAATKQTDNLRKLELSRSVVLYADGEEEKLREIDALPILNDRPFGYLALGTNGKARFGKDAFQFVRDKYGCDSYSVSVRDSTGKEIPLDYNKGVESQLAKEGCATGRVTVTERTVYGDVASYEAVYFSGAENPAKITVRRLVDGQEKEDVILQDMEGMTLTADAFSIKGLEEALDPYNIVLIRDEGDGQWCYAADQLPKETWSDSGLYEISVINRIGNRFSFFVKVNPSKLATISFQGDGTEAQESIVASIGDKNVTLPRLQREGYQFLGYTDGDARVYGEMIDEVDFTGSKVLTALWKEDRAANDTSELEEEIVEVEEKNLTPDAEVEEKNLTPGAEERAPAPFYALIVALLLVGIGALFFLRRRSRDHKS